MEEYKTECYITKKDGTFTTLEKNFLNQKKYDKWRRKTEEKALSEFYNEKIKIISNDI